MLTRNVKNVILFTKVILTSLLILYLLISKTFRNFAAVENPHPCMQWDAVACFMRTIADRVVLI